MMIVIGTTALEYHGVHLRDLNIPKDCAVMSTDMEMSRDTIIVPQYKLFKQFYNIGILKMTNKVNIDTLVTEIFEAFNLTDPKYPSSSYSVECLPNLPNFNNFERIDQVGGEDEGNYAHTIFKWKDVYYKLIYSYYSYNGYDFEDAECYVVTPKEKMVIVYE